MAEPPTVQVVSRRRFLRQAFVFSAAATGGLTGCGSGTGTAVAPAPPTIPADEVAHVLMVGDWGTSDDLKGQMQVGAAMQAYVAAQKIDTAALLLLGDNFYGDLTGGVASPRWDSQFEKQYPASVFNCPAYAVLGNHDYQVLPESKADAELAYAQTGKSRFTMPARYYRFSLPATNPLITFLALDSNMPNEPAQPVPPDATYFTPDADTAQAELAWLQQQLNEPLSTPFLACMAHHPVYSNGPHGDNKSLIRNWDPLLRQHNVHLYLAGHDHDLQHLEFEGHPTSFVLSGGGGANLAALPKSPGYGPFADEVHGFTHLMVQPKLLTMKHVDSTGTVLHAFTKTPAGVVTVL